MVLRHRRMLDRLETKGMVSSDRSDLHVRLPTIRDGADVRQTGDQLVEKLYQGEPGLLVLHLLKSHQLDPRQAGSQAVLDEMTKKKGSDLPPSDASSSIALFVTLIRSIHLRPPRWIVFNVSPCFSVNRGATPMTIVCSCGKRLEARQGSRSLGTLPSVRHGVSYPKPRRASRDNMRRRHEPRGGTSPIRGTRPRISGQIPHRRATGRRSAPAT